MSTNTEIKSLGPLISVKGFAIVKLVSTTEPSPRERAIAPKDARSNETAKISLVESRSYSSKSGYIPWVFAIREED